MAGSMESGYDPQEWATKSHTDILWTGLFALSICILAGCRNTAESKYSLINWPQKTVGLVLGDECYNATAEFLPDFYRFGMSGMHKSSPPTAC